MEVVRYCQFPLVIMLTRPSRFLFATEQGHFPVGDYMTLRETAESAAGCRKVQEITKMWVNAKSHALRCMSFLPELFVNA